MNNSAVEIHVEEPVKRKMTSYKCKTCNTKFSTMKKLRDHSHIGCDYRPQSPESFPPKSNVKTQKTVIRKITEYHLPKEISLKKVAKNTESTGKRRNTGGNIESLLKNLNNSIKVSQTGLKGPTKNQKTKRLKDSVGKSKAPGPIQNICKNLPSEIKLVRLATNKKAKNNKQKQKNDKKDSSGKCIWKCDQCPQIFSHRAHLEAHELVCAPKFVPVKSKQKLEIRRVSDKQFSYAGLLTGHDKPVHVDTESTCIVCSRTFSNHFGLLNHQMFSHKARVGRLEDIINDDDEEMKKLKKRTQFLCDTCGKNFSQKFLLKRHIRMHLGIKNLECSYCGRKFGESDTLKKHERIHTGEKPYTCHLCGCAFRQSAPFKAHLRTHTGERPYVCKHCGTGFLTNQMLKYHYQKGCMEIAKISGDINSKINVSLMWTDMPVDDIVY